MLSLTRRSSSGLSLNSQYTLSRSFGNTSGSNEALTAANNARTLDQFDYDLGYNAFDVRHVQRQRAVSGAVRTRAQPPDERRGGRGARRMGRRRDRQRAQ